MAIVAVLIFIGVFTVIALALYALGAESARNKKQMLSTLDSALSNVATEMPEIVLDFRKKDDYSTLPWLSRMLVKAEIAPKMHSLLNQADLNWTAGKLMLMCAACFAVPAYIVNLRTGNILFSLASGLLVGPAPLLFVLLKRRQRFSKFEQGLPEALDLMVSALRVGHSLNAAMGLVARECAAPVGTEFKTCFEEQNFGLELRTAFDNMIKRVPLQDLKIIATAIMIQKESGGNLAEVLDKTSHVIRERFRLKRQINVHTAQGRLTGWILSALPVFLGFALYIVNPEQMSLLWHRELGIKLLWASAGMTVIGSVIINRIVNMEV